MCVRPKGMGTDHICSGAAYTAPLTINALKGETRTFTARIWWFLGA